MKNNLKKLRKEAGFKNRDDFAAALGVNKYTYRNWEQGVREFNVLDAWKMADALGCDIDDIVGRSKQETPNDPS